ncbi:MAG TPA: PepSY-like domain-containing protein [Chryseolinea sp.]|nr:PepSY-like domain-containing protein [Chryseolinea sp.]
MKSWLIVLLGLCAAPSVNGQKVSEESVPQPVRAGLPKSYQAKGVEWSREDANYEATFRKDGKEVSLVIDATGNTIETETEIKSADLPAAVINSVKNDYPSYTIAEAAKIVTADGHVTYEAEVGKGKETFDLIFDTAGKLVSKEVKNGHD